MEFGCGGVGLRTSRGDVVNLYFWHLETEEDVCVRHEDFLGRADSPRVKRELVRRMAMYDRRVQQKLARRIAKLERTLDYGVPVIEVPLAVTDHEMTARGPSSIVAVGARGI